MTEYTAELDVVGRLCMLIVHILGLEKNIKSGLAFCLEALGKVQNVSHKEIMPFYPRRPYGIAQQTGFGLLTIIVKAVLCLQLTEFFYIAALCYRRFCYGY